MDFHMLTRRDLQALCKKNKIPANMTNVAMVESLKALEIVEGFEEFLATCESETAQSSIDSPARSEVTSPCVPPTGGRTTRRRTAKEEPETAKPSIRAQRTTRKTRAKDADEPQAEALETPVVASRTYGRRKAQEVSACRKMDSRLKECADEEKKDLLVTPAPSGVTTRRRRGAKEGTEVTRVYGTRRSVRLAGKNVELSSEAGNENLDFSKKELFTNDYQELKLNKKESMEVMDKTSGITGGFDAEIAGEENSEKQDEAEVVSAEKQETPAVNEVELVPAIEEEMVNHSESDGIVSDLKESCDVEIEEMGFEPEIEANLEKEECDEIGASDDEIKAQENDGSRDVQICEIEMEIEVEKIEQIANKDAGYVDQAANDVLENEGHDSDNAALETEDNFGIAVFSCDICDHDEVLEINGSHDIQSSEMETEVEKTEGQKTDAGYVDQVVSCEGKDALESEGYEGEGREDEFAEGVQKPILESEADVQEDSSSEMELKSDESDSLDLEATDDGSLPSDDSSKKDDTIEAKDEVPCLVQPTCLSPIRASSASKASSSAKKKRTTAVSDNKENIGNGGKLILTKERVKIARRNKKYADMSMRQLEKMLRDMLHITNKPSNNENDIEVPARPALKALPENRQAI